MIKSDQILFGDPRDTLWRTLQTFSATRIVIAVTLLAYLSFSTRQGFWITDGFLYREACGIYVVQAIIFFILSVYEKRRFLLQLTTGIAIDIFVISILYVAAAGTKGGLVILYLFPLAGGAILAPLPLALFFASAVAILLLIENWYRVFQLMPDETTSQAGLYGAAFFAAAYVINRLAARLIRQEKLAVERGHDLHIQQAINRLVVADISDGILVLDQEGAIHIANPAAERMLNLSLRQLGPRYQLSQLPWLQPLVEALSIWSAQRNDRREEDADRPMFVHVKPDGGQEAGSAASGWNERSGAAVHLKLRFATVGTGRPGEERIIIFLQDVSDIENQAQQLKLASMGRLTASIAHEVRNPLSAVSYAASLLTEEVSDPGQRRLLNIIGDNVTRLNRMIEDILKLSRKAQAPTEPILLARTTQEILDEFQETHALRPGLIRIGNMNSHRILFDPLHLREVIVNLLTNALRYASGKDGSIELYLMKSAANRLELHIQDDGPAISPEVRAHLFEPFYTTSRKGTGLGLYLARELCLNNGAMLNYEYRADPSGMAPDESLGRFVITFARHNAV